MAHIEFLVEEPSAENALNNLLPKILPSGVTFRIHPHNGKSDLLKKLPGRLKGYKRWIRDDCKIVVLVDEDRQDCRLIKLKLEDIAQHSGFATKSAANGVFQVLNRIAIEELEAWFFGDIPALVSAYPKVSAALAEIAAYRIPDSIKGGTWEKLEKVLQQAGYFPTGLPKLEVASAISRYMTPASNRSKSFQVFLSGLHAITR